MSAIDDYLNNVPELERAELERVRQIVRGHVPEAEEVISYGMPGFKYKGKYLLGLAAFKDHLSLFPTAHPVEILKHKLGEFEVSKGTIQFTIHHPIPDELIKELVDVRQRDIA
jgi:uncharacterized protein YdhG (YjbR/CyaY superfamily)